MLPQSYLMNRGRKKAQKERGTSEMKTTIRRNRIGATASTLLVALVLGLYSCCTAMAEGYHAEAVAAIAAESTSDTAAVSKANSEEKTAAVSIAVSTSNGTAVSTSNGTAASKADTEDLFERAGIRDSYAKQEAQRGEYNGTVQLIQTNKYQNINCMEVVPLEMKENLPMLVFLPGTGGEWGLALPKAQQGWAEEINSLGGNARFTLFEKARHIDTPSILAIPDVWELILSAEKI